VVNGQDGWHANFQWAQQGSDYRIDLIGPLGQGRVWSRATDVRSASRPRTANTGPRPIPMPCWSKVSACACPWRFALLGARLAGAGSTPVLQTDADGRLIRLEQNGWIIDYPAYTPRQLNLRLPARIVARRQDLSVKLVIEQWKL
jgi:outer membrane lipoprotein LolB